MKLSKRIFAVLLSLLMVLSVLPLSAAFAADADVPGEEGYESVPDFLPEDTDEAYTQDGWVTLPAPEPYATTPAYEGYDETVDWDGVLAAAWEVVYTDKTEVDISEFNVQYNDGNRQYLYFNMYYNPVFLRLGFSYTISGGKIAKLRYTNGDSAANYAKYTACENAIDTILYGIKDNSDLSDLEKCLLVHDRLAVWCEYDVSNYVAHTIPEDSYSAYGALALRVAVCNGICLAYGWMLDILGIENYYTNSDQINHAWNKVILDGEAYYVDVTWDDPTTDTAGYVEHTNFMLSFPTFSARHRNSDDYDQTPSSTIYENLFSTAARSEILYINGSFYYVKKASGELIKREHDGTETVLKTLDYIHRYAYDGGTASYNITPKLLAMGDTILYTTPKTVRAYNTVTGEDTLAFTPREDIYPDARAALVGLQQIDGTVYATAAYFYYSQAEKPAQTDSFTYCPHSSYTQLQLLPGADCATRGEKKMICPVCGKLQFVAGQGAYGPHFYTAATVKPEAEKTGATCTSPAVYYYSCAVCGAVENNVAHTFTDGEPIPHNFERRSSTPATPSCPGHSLLECTGCSLLKNGEFTFYAGNTASGVIGDAFAWQIVDGVLSVFGEGALPDFSAAAPAPWSAYADSITAVYVNDGINKIGAYDFCSLPNMETVRLPEEVTVIGAYAFANDVSLAAFVCPEALTRIEDKAFSSNAALASLEYNGALRHIGNSAFENLESLSTIVLPGTLTSLGNGAFYRAKNVSTIIVEEGFTYLPSFYFPYSTGTSVLNTIRLPSTMTTIGEINAYNVLTWCANIEVAPENPAFTSVDGVLFNKDVSRLVKYPAKKTDVYYKVPSTVSAIGGRAFYATEKLKYLDLSDTAITSLEAAVIGSNKYSPIGSLYTGNVRLNLPAGLTSLGSLAFGSLSYMNRLYIPASVTTVSESFMAQANKPVVTTNSDSAAVAAACETLGQTYSVLSSHVHAYTAAEYTVAGDCGSPGFTIKTCECGQFEYNEVPASHSFTAKQVKEDALKTPATCTTLAVYYFSCADCGAVERNDANTFTAGVYADHKYTAAVVKDDALKTPATCTSPAVYYFSCKDCGAVERNDENTFTDGGTIGHDWTWKIDTPATCSAPGVKHRECKKCHARQDENTVEPATGVHTYTAAAVKDDALKTPATCTTLAVYYFSCADCGAVERNDANTFTAGVYADHKYTAAAVNDDALKTPATCTSPAVYYFSCKDCGAVERNDANTFTDGGTIGHDWTWKIDTPATCSTPGAKHRECKKCHARQDENTVEPATGVHTYTAAMVKEDALKTPATCTTLAVYYFSCADCGAVERNDANTFTAGVYADHKYTAAAVKDDALKTPATCTSPAVYYFSCKDCGAVERNDANTFTDGGTIGHDWTWKIDTPATCSTPGVKHQECKNCHARQNENTAIPKNTDHRWNGGVVTKPATCAETGERVFTCSVCGAVRPETIGKTGHADGDGDGYCDVCHTDLDAAGRCKYCGEKHTGFFGSIVKFFHSILYFFKNLFR